MFSLAKWIVFITSKLLGKIINIIVLKQFKNEKAMKRN